MALFVLSIIYKIRRIYGFKQTKPKRNVTTKGFTE